MYDRLYPGRGGLKQSFCNGVDHFVQAAMLHKDFDINGVIDVRALIAIAEGSRAQAK